MTAEPEPLGEAVLRAQQAALGRRYGEAAGICDDLLLRAPDEPSALALRGMLAAQTGDPHRGLDLVARAVGLRSDVAAWHSNLGMLYRADCRMAEALRSANEAVNLEPDNPDALVTLSLVLADLDRFGPAIAALVRAVGVAPEHAMAHLALAQCLLAIGEFEAGWREYEWRNRTEAGRATMPAATSAAWNGMRLDGGKLLVVGDQGYGDTIQFARYLPSLAARCDEVILGCSPELAPLLRPLLPAGRLFTEWTGVPGHAAHVRLSSCPYLFGADQAMRWEVPYLFAEPARVAAWAPRICAPEGMLRVGLCWSGRPTHPNDRRRSLSLTALAPLGKVPGVSWVLLQPAVSEADVRVACEAFGPVTIPGAQLGDFAETAALIENLDLVITVDTAVGHLAGALGQPVWILLAQAADFRWMRQRSDSPWYPTARLFRQPSPGEWAPVIAEVVNALRTYR